MIVNLLNHTPLEVADAAISKCWDKSVAADKVCERIERVANKNKHASTIEHLVYNFDIDGISRACLQEVARHRIASYSVKSTRYTLKELGSEELPMNTTETFDRDGIQDAQEMRLQMKERASKYVVFTHVPLVDMKIIDALEGLRYAIVTGVSNDKAKYCLPEAYKTSLVMTINARSLQNFLELRSSKSALWEIQDLAKAMYNALPEEHKFLFSSLLIV